MQSQGTRRTWYKHWRRYTIGMNKSSWWNNLPGIYSSEEQTSNCKAWDISWQTSLWHLPSVQFDTWWLDIFGHFCLSCNWLIFHSDTYLQRNLVTRYAMLRKSHTISKLGLSANKGREQRRLGSSLKSRMGTRPLKFFWVTTSRVPMLWKGKSWEKGKERGKRKERKKKDTCDGFYPEVWGERTTKR